MNILSKPDPLVLAITVLAFLISFIPLSSTHVMYWDGLDTIFLASNLSWRECFDAVLFRDVYSFRPMAFMTLKIFYTVFGMNLSSFSLMKSIFLISFSLSVYYMFLTLGVERRRTFIITLFSTISASSISSTLKIADIETIAVSLSFLSLLSFIRLGRSEKKYLLLTLASAVSAMLFKEAVRIMLPLLLLVYISVFMIKRSSNRLKFETTLSERQKISLAMVLIFSLLLSYPNMQNPSSSLTTKYSFSPEGFFIVAETVFYQLSYPLTFTAAIILCISLFSFNRKGYAISGLVIGVLLLVWSMMLPIYFDVSLEGTMLSQTDNPGARVFICIFLFSLALHGIKGDRNVRMSSIFILLVLSVYTVYLIFIPFSRQSISVRAFLIAVPFLYFMIINAVDKMRKDSGCHKTRRYLSALLLATVLLSSFSVVFCSADMMRSFHALSEMRHETIGFISEYQAESDVIFYNDEINRIENIEFRRFGKEMDRTFIFMDSEAESLSDIETEFCVKTSYYPETDIFYFFLSKEHPDMAADAEEISLLMNRYGENAFPWLSEKLSYSEYFYFNWPWYSDFTGSRVKRIYTNPNSIEEFLEKNGELLFSSEKHAFKKFAGFDGMLFRLTKGIKLFYEYSFEGRFYRVNRSDVCGYRTGLKKYIEFCDSKTFGLINPFREERYAYSEFICYPYENASVSISFNGIEAYSGESGPKRKSIFIGSASMGENIFLVKNTGRQADNMYCEIKTMLMDPRTIFIVPGKGITVAETSDEYISESESLFYIQSPGQMRAEIVLKVLPTKEYESIVISLNNRTTLESEPEENEINLIMNLDEGVNMLSIEAKTEKGTASPGQYFTIEAMMIASIS